MFLETKENKNQNDQKVRIDIFSLIIWNPSIGFLKQINILYYND